MRSENAETSADSRIVADLKRLGGIRDGALVAITVVYLLGFVSWASYALANNIGFVALLDAQYLLAGLVPALSLAIVYGLCRSPPRVRFAAVIVAFVVMFVSDRLSKSDDAAFAAVWAYVIILALLVLTVYNALDRGSAPSFWHRVWLAAQWPIAAVVVVAALVWYCLRVYPILPPELGGPLTRCADMVVDAAAVPAEFWTRSGIAVVKMGESRIAIEKATVLLANESTVILRGHGSVGTVALSRSAVGAIAWCKS